MASSAFGTPVDGSHAFSELDLVRLRFDTADEEVIFKEATLGTVVYVHEAGVAYEVEFSEPESAVLTLGPLDIVAA